MDQFKCNIEPLSRGSNPRLYCRTHNIPCVREPDPTPADPKRVKEICPISGQFEYVDFRETI